MKKPTKILLGGLVLAALAIAAGRFRAHHLEQQVLLLEAQCVQEDVAAKKAQPDGPWQQFALVCDAKSLAHGGGDQASVGIQADIEQAYWDWQNAEGQGEYAAVIITLLAALPWLWYFLLRRIAELRAAITGNPPNR